MRSAGFFAERSFHQFPMTQKTPVMVAIEQCMTEGLKILHMIALLTGVGYHKHYNIVTYESIL